MEFLFFRTRCYPLPSRPFPKSPTVFPFHIPPPGYTPCLLPLHFSSFFGITFPFMGPGAELFFSFCIFTRFSGSWHFFCFFFVFLGCLSPLQISTMKWVLFSSTTAGFFSQFFTAHKFRTSPSFPTSFFFPSWRFVSRVEFSQGAPNAFRKFFLFVQIFFLSNFFF